MSTLIERLKLYFEIVINWFSRLICWKRNRHRRNSGSLLPTTITPANNSEPSANPQSPTYMYSSSSIVNTYTTHVNSTWNLMKNQPQTNQQNKPSDESEPDYFQELKPTIKRQKKIRINQNENKLSERLNVNSNYSILEEDQADNGWEDDNVVDDKELAQNLRLLKIAERERRVAEHQKAIQQKEQLRKSKMQKQNFFATKLS